MLSPDLTARRTCGINPRILAGAEPAFLLCWASPGSTLSAGWWKGGYDTRATLASDGVFVKGGDNGGQIDPTGESPWDACRREAREECGLELQRGRLASVDFRSQGPKRPGGVRFLFDCGEFSDEESEFLQALQVQFDIPDDVAESLVNEAIDAL